MLDALFPEAVAEQALVEFLDEAGWRLEFDDVGILSVPQDPPPKLISRAFIAAHAPDVLLGDHFEAVFALAPEWVGENVRGRAGYLRLYFDAEGRFVTEDRSLRP